MDEETRAKLRREIQDVLGLPFYDSSRELNSLNEHVENSIDEIIDVVLRAS